MESNKSAHLILLEKSWKFFKNFHLRKMSVGQKSLWIFASRSKSDKRGNRTSSFGNKPKFSKDQRSIFGNFFLFLGAKRFCPDLIISYFADS
ncbi:hypothetical protein HMPREF1328_02301 [Enterococcus faecalis ERV103]|nr:hypothetical protein HMPREF1328_02301 [Enterococcus faecalis ERV103]